MIDGVATSSDGLNEIEDWYRSMESNLAEQIESLRSGFKA